MVAADFFLSNILNKKKRLDNDIISSVRSFFHKRLRETVKLVISKVPEELNVTIYSNCATG